MHPVESVTWKEARQVLPRYDLDLPTESAWEHAARAGTTRPWLHQTTLEGFDRLENIADATWGEASPAGVPFEPSLDDGYAVHAPVGSFVPNGFGLYDILGNVYEWTASRMHDDVVPAAPGRGVREAENIRSANRNRRVFRGGAYKTTLKIGRVSNRSIAPEDARSSALGLRPVRWLVPAPE